MKRIGSINVHGRHIPIYKTKKMPEGTEGFWGFYDITSRKIVLNHERKLSKRFKEEILYHELFHALMDRIGFNAMQLEDNMHELLCESFRNFISDHFELKDKKILKKL